MLKKIFIGVLVLGGAYAAYTKLIASFRFSLGIPQPIYNLNNPTNLELFIPITIENDTRISATIDSITGGVFYGNTKLLNIAFYNIPILAQGKSTRTIQGTIDIVQLGTDAVSLVQSGNLFSRLYIKATALSNGKRFDINQSIAIA
jgi:hypothetical protein